MKGKYEILKFVYTIVSEKLQPLQYSVSTHELLLRLKGDWQPEYLEELVRDGYIVLLRDAAGIMLRITEKGWQKAKMKLAFRVNP